ncbi:hypothetical protein AB0J63_40320 [Streptosporangium canum]|uniref:hypothetical protein n=1 Tax=Streptosporangium canum TaxID=324952 RepID=UPI0034442D1E
MTACPSDLAQVADGPHLALFADGLDTAIYRLDPEMRRFQRMSVAEGFAGLLTASDSGEVVAALASTAYEPMNVHAGPPADRLTRLSDTRPELRALTWGRQERLSYTASDGLDLDGLLILPAGKSRHDGPFPLITLVHGGPYDRYADRATRSRNAVTSSTCCGVPACGSTDGSLIPDRITREGRSGWKRCRGGRRVDLRRSDVRQKDHPVVGSGSIGDMSAASCAACAAVTRTLR